VTLWLWGIIINLLTGPGYYDVALRDFGLSLGALTLGRLAWIHHLEAHRQTETHADRGSAASLPGEKYPLAKSH